MPIFGVLDTNVVLDLYLFGDPKYHCLHRFLLPNLQNTNTDIIENDCIKWIATDAMRDELQRVMTVKNTAYRRLQKALLHHNTTPKAVLCCFDEHVKLLPNAPPARIRCQDPKDQMFIDLAIEYKAILYSKDQDILCLENRLKNQGVRINHLHLIHQLP